MASNVPFKQMEALLQQQAKMTTYTAQVNAYQTPYNQYANQGMAQATYTAGGTMGGGGLSAGYLTSIGGLTSGYTQAVINTGHTHTISGAYNMAVPTPTGSKVQVVLTDANGFDLNIFVDVAYASIIAQISTQHGAVKYQQMPYVTPKHKMVDGDFSLDEIAQAEEIMEDLRA